MYSTLRFLSALALISTAMPSVQAQPYLATELETCSSGSFFLLDFEEDAAGNALSEGDVITEQWASKGIHIVGVGSSISGPAMIFNTNTPGSNGNNAGEDPDLGTPNETCPGGGPGKGSGGEAGQPFENCFVQDNVLILQENDDSDPDDDAEGGLLTLDFDQEMTIQELHILDADNPDEVVVHFYDNTSTQITEIPLGNAGDNGLIRLELNVTGVYKMEVEFLSSGSLARAQMCYGNTNKAAIGDRVWLDENKDGRQDENEVGIGGVTVFLLDENGFKLDETETDPSGFYGFTDLDPGTYSLQFFPPDGFSITLKDKGNDLFDSDVDLTTGKTEPTELVAGENDLSWDAGLFLGESLPVELTTFSAEVEADRLLLNWRTQSENDNAGFAIELARAGEVFQEIGFVGGQGTTTEASDYRFTRETLLPGLYRVRLKQIDFGGSARYSSILEVEVDLAGAFMLAAPYPNPFNPQTTLSFAVRQAEAVRLVLYDLTGRELRTLYTGTPEAGATLNVRLDGSNLTSGTYLVRLESATFSATQTVTLLK